MNIFILDTDIKKIAEYHNDTHLSKMLLEITQMMCTTHHVTGTPKEQIPYRKCHENHPCTKWVRESIENYKWSLEFAQALSDEYFYRKGKWCKCQETLDWLKVNIPDLPNTLQTPFAMAINVEKCGDAIVEGNIVQSYRNYHKLYKQGFTRGEKYYPYKWTKRDRPSFMD